MQLNLTPEQEKLAKEVLTKDGQSLEVAFMGLIYRKKDKKETKKFPELVRQKTKPIRFSKNDNGTFVVTKEAPESVKDWAKNG